MFKKKEEQAEEYITPEKEYTQMNENLGESIDPRYLDPMISGNMGYMPNSMQQQNNDTLIMQSFQTIETTLQNLENSLKGLYWNPIKKEYQKKHEPLLNDEGINELMFYIRSHFGVNTVVTNLDDTEISLIMMDFATTLCRLLAYNYENFEIKNPTHLDVIQTTFENVMYMALKRSYNFGTFDKLSGATRRLENVAGIQEPQKKGWLKYI